jgi:hypothetical protein
MAADQPDDLRVTADHVGERSGLLGPTVATDIMGVDVERWMVDE